MDRNKGFVLFPFLVVLIAIIGVGGWWLFKQQGLPGKNIQNQEKNISTENWQTYTNKKMGFSIKVPPGWFTHKESDPFGNRYEATFSYPIDNPTLQSWGSGQKAAFQVVVSLSEGKSVTGKVQELIKSPYSFRSNQTTPITIGGQPGLVIYDKDIADGEYGREIIVNYGKLEYFFTLATPKGINSNKDYPEVKLNEFLPVFEKILSTVEFFEQSENGRFCGGKEKEQCPPGYKCEIPDLGEVTYPSPYYPIGTCIKK